MRGGIGAVRKSVSEWVSRVSRAKKSGLGWLILGFVDVDGGVFSECLLILGLWMWMEVCWRKLVEGGNEKGCKR